MYYVYLLSPVLHTFLLLPLSVEELSKASVQNDKWFWMEKFTILSKSLKSHAPYFLFFSLAFFFFQRKKITCWFEFQLKRGKTEYVYIILPYGFTNFNNKTNKTNKKYTYYIQPTIEWVECMPTDIIFHPYTKKLNTHTRNTIQQYTQYYCPFASERRTRS